MSLQELHIKALEEQVANLTRDCHYLISLLNQSDEIDWENWPQGKNIKEDLERSKDFFDAMKRHKAEFQRQRKENIRKAREELSNRWHKENDYQQNQRFYDKNCSILFEICDML